ncbi:Cytosolic purine 5'-nucleotidase-like protein [Drosera capensis]
MAAISAAMLFPNLRSLSGRRRSPMLSSRCALDEKAAVVVGVEKFKLTTSSKCEVDYLGQSTRGDLNVNPDYLGSFGDNGHVVFGGAIEEVARVEAEEAEKLLIQLGLSGPYSALHSPRGIFCTRTLNLRSISAIGYDMDYTLIHYNVMHSQHGDYSPLALEAWEGRAYDYCMENLRNMGFPVDGLSFDPNLVIRGLVIDKEKGNLVKADRFGYVKRAMHGTTMLSNRAVSEIYGRELVDLRKENRWEFLNTFFSVSEAVAYMQMVDRLDAGDVTMGVGPIDYKGLYKAVGKALFRAHVEGQLKSEIMSKPELFVEPDPDLPLVLLDQKEAGKKLLLITNSDYLYTDKMMQHSFNRFLPNDMGWRDLFDIVSVKLPPKLLVITSARKPEFFQMSHPMYEIVTDAGLMRPCFKIKMGGLYSGGSAQMVENSLGVHGDEILYVGDHIYTDVSQSKVHLRWRTALVCRELEIEYDALINSRGHRSELIELINQKEVLGDLFNQLRLVLQRRNNFRPAQELTEKMQKLLIVMQRIDQAILPLMERDGELFNERALGETSQGGNECYLDYSFVTNICKCACVESASFDMELTLCLAEPVVNMISNHSAAAVVFSSNSFGSHRPCFGLAGMLISTPRGFPISSTTLLSCTSTLRNRRWPMIHTLSTARNLVRTRACSPSCSTATSSP